MVAEGEVVKVGDVIARIDESASKGGSAKSAGQEKPAAPEQKAPSSEQAEKPDPGPAVRRMLAENPVDTSAIQGSGKGGRLTKGDLLAHQGTPGPANQPAAPSAPETPAPQVSLPSLSAGREETRKPMSMLRRRIAERLLGAQSQAAILTTFNEIDMTEVMALRKAV